MFIHLILHKILPNIIRHYTIDILTRGIDSRTIVDARLIVKPEIIRWGSIPAYLRSQPTMRRICDVKFTSLFYECKIGGTILRPTLYNKGALQYTQRSQTNVALLSALWVTARDLWERITSSACDHTILCCYKISLYDVTRATPPVATVSKYCHKYGLHTKSQTLSSFVSAWDRFV